MSIIAKVVFSSRKYICITRWRVYSGINGPLEISLVCSRHNQVKPLPVGGGGATEGAAEVETKNGHPGEHRDTGEVTLQPVLSIHGIVVEFLWEF